MAFFFAYSAVRTAAQNLGFTCAIYFSINIYYGCLCKFLPFTPQHRGHQTDLRHPDAYTPEVLPSAHRASGYGIAIGCNRIMGLISAFVATYANTATSAPVYLCAALYIAMVRPPRTSTRCFGPPNTDFCSNRPSWPLQCRSNPMARDPCRAPQCQPKKGS